MLDARFVREKVESVGSGLKKRGVFIRTPTLAYSGTGEILFYGMAINPGIRSPGRPP